MKKYNWAFIGCGSIANEAAKAFLATGREIYSVFSRRAQKAAEFAEKYNIKKVCRTADEIFEDENVEIIYIATPHNSHIDYIIRALGSGKHVLCEKSITLNSAELERAAALAEEKGLVLAEAMTLYHMPLYNKLEKLIKSGALGELNMIEVNLGSPKKYDMKNRFFNPELAGGAMLDLGIYALSCVRFFMSETPSVVSSVVKKAPTGVDEQAAIILNNSKNEMASVLLSLSSKLPKRATASLDKAFIEIYEYPRSAKAVVTYTADGHSETIRAGRADRALAYEIADTEKAAGGGNGNIYLDYSRDVMRLMTEIREEWGVKYPEEK